MARPGQGPGPVGAQGRLVSAWRAQAGGVRARWDQQRSCRRAQERGRRDPGRSQKAGKLEHSTRGMSPLKLRPRYLAKAQPPARPQAPPAGLSNDVHTL